MREFKIDKPDKKETEKNYMFVIPDETWNKIINFNIQAN